MHTSPCRHTVRTRHRPAVCVLNAPQAHTAQRREPILRKQGSLDVQHRGGLTAFIPSIMTTSTGGDDRCEIKHCFRLLPWEGSKFQDMRHAAGSVTDRRTVTRTGGPGGPLRKAVSTHTRYITFKEVM